MPKPPPDPEPQVDRRTLPRDRPWLKKPRPTRRTGSRVPGAKLGARLSDFPTLSVRVPRLTADRLTALAAVRAEPLGVMLAVAVTDYLAAQDATTTARVASVARRVQRNRIAAKKGRPT